MAVNIVSGSGVWCQSEVNRPLSYWAVEDDPAPCCFMLCPWISGMLSFVMSCRKLIELCNGCVGKWLRFGESLYSMGSRHLALLCSMVTVDVNIIKDLTRIIQNSFDPWTGCFLSHWVGLGWGHTVWEGQQASKQTAYHFETISSIYIPDFAKSATAALADFCKTNVFLTIGNVFNEKKRH